MKETVVALKKMEEEGVVIFTPLVPQLGETFTQLDFITAFGGRTNSIIAAQHAGKVVSAAISAGAIKKSQENGEFHWTEGMKAVTQKIGEIAAEYQESVAAGGSQ